MFYLTLFAITAILFFFAQKSYERSHIVFYALSYSAILLLAFFAGVRDNSIGADIGVYGLQTFTNAQYSDSVSDAFGDSWVEPGYYIINFIAAHTVGAIGFSFFLQSLIIHALAFHGMKFFMKTVPLWIGMLIFVVTFYNHSLNLMRQMIAVAFLLWSTQYLVARDFKKLLLCAIFAAVFLHKTVVVAYAAYFLIYYIMGKEEPQQKKLIVLMVIVGAVALAAFVAILSYLVTAVPYFQQYEAYGGATMHTKGWAPALSKRDMIYQGGLLFIALFLIRKGYNQMEQRYLVVLIILITTGAQMLGLFTFFATRMAYYFIAAEVPIFIDFIRRSRVSQPVSASLCSVILMFNLYVTVRNFFYFNWGSTYPYSSDVLGF